MKTCVLILLLFLTVFIAPAQNENTKWYFGSYVALDFMSNPPAVLNDNAMQSSEGCASIADAAGNLLFYTNGETLWNKQNTIMANGAGLLGDMSSIQSAVIINHQSNLNLYYVFTMSASMDFHYSIVDMSLAAGMGSVTVKNVPLYAAPCLEQLCATKHGNGTDYWVMMHEGGAGFPSNNFRAYLLTSAGVNTTAVVSSVGTPSSNGGQIKFSVSGQKLGMGGNGNYGTIYDFNNNTGIVSPSLTLAIANWGAYGCEFSPDGTKFYCTSDDGLIQWDLNAGSNAAVISSSVVLYNNSLNDLASVQLAPNGKIYIATYASSSISIINAPNAAGANCNFVYNAQPVSNGNITSISLYGLPNQVLSCHISIASLSNFNCANAGSIAVSGAIGNINYTWSNGISTYATQQVNNLSAGQWNVTVTDEASCSAQTVVTVPQNPIVVTPSITAGSGHFVSCSGDTLVLIASGANSYTWSNGAQTSSILVLPTPTSTSNITYYVTGTDNNGCTGSSAVVTVSIAPPPTLSINASNSFTLCSPQMQTLTVSGAYNYMWKWGATAWATSTFLIVNPGVTTQYSITGTDENGCLSSKVVTVSIGCLGINELGAESGELRIYPNPAVEIINVESGMMNEKKIEIFVYDVLGKEIQNEKLKVENGATQIDVSALPKGIYFVKVGSDVRKFVKE